MVNYQPFGAPDFMDMQIYFKTFADTGNYRSYVKMYEVFREIYFIVIYLICIIL